MSAISVEDVRCLVEKVVALLPGFTFRELYFLSQKESTTTSRKYRKTSRVRKQPGRIRQIKQQALEQAREVRLLLDVEALVEMTRQSLSSFAVEVGLKVATCLAGGRSH